jgi:transcriptional regulator with XRE-family HTH domain
LRALREARGRSQLWVEAEADLGTGYLQRVESGKVAQPERPTLERVLSALDARYGERREALEAFGYAVGAPLPSSADLEWARSVAHRELGDYPYPAYALDLTTRLLAWNRHFPRLLGASADDAWMERLARRPLLELWFDPASPLARLVLEPHVLLPALIRALRYEVLHLGPGEWYEGLLVGLMRIPRFRQYWEAPEAEPEVVGAARALTPLRLTAPGVGAMRFRLASEPFSRDPRFRAIYYLPADIATMRRWQAWEAEGRAQ